MSDRDALPDPIDAAYVQAEALLSDEAARSARRARVLAAVAREGETPTAAAASFLRQPVWRRGGWLAAASVAGLGVFVAVHIYQPAPSQPQTAPTAAAVQAPAAPTPVVSGIAAAPTPSAGVASQTPRPAPRTPAVAPPPSPPLSIPPAPRAFPAAAAAPPPPPPDAAAGEQSMPAPSASYPARGSGLVSGQDAVDAQSAARADAKSAPLAAFAPPAPQSRFESSAGPPSDRAARLRAAAAAGRTAEVEALLAQGVPVDAPDANGDTALMHSIQADHPAAAALLRRYGASLDRRNHAGERARDMAAAKGDAALSQALGLEP